MAAVENFEFRSVVQTEPVDIVRGALLFARGIAYPQLDIAACQAQLRQLAREARSVVPRRGASEDRAAALARYLFQDIGFRGNIADYGDPRNSYLNEVLDRKLGLPITLSVLYTFVAGKTGIEAYGVGLPGHFVVAVEGQNGPAYFDPFHGGRRVTEQDCRRLVAESTGYAGPLRREWLDRVPPVGVLTRMLANLRLAYANQERWDEAASVVRHLRWLEPQAAAHVRDLGLIHYRNNDPRLAAHYLDRYLRLAPDASDNGEIRQGIKVLLADWAHLN